MELSGPDGAQVTITQGMVDGRQALMVRTPDALTLEHALSIFAHVLTARGNGDVEVYEAGWHRGQWEARYR